MKLSDVFVVALTAVLLLGAVYMINSEFNSNFVSYESIIPASVQNIQNEALQFYPNMRFQHSLIYFEIDSDCDAERRENIVEALKSIEEKTVLRFEESINPNINFACSGDASEYDSEDGRHVVVGLAKPEDILNLTNFYMTQKAKVTLLTPEKCATPQVAFHEILHALGFDHSDDEKNIMFPITSCNQKINESIIDEINRIYSTPELPDLVIEKIEANKTGRYLDFVIEVANYGLTDAKNVTLNIVSEGKLIKRYTFSEIEIGKRNELMMQNIRTGAKGEIVFSLEMEQGDLNEENNQARIIPVGE